MPSSQELTLKYAKRNFISHWMDGAFWGSGFAALGLFTIFPGLIHELAIREPLIKPWENRLATLAGICFFGISQFFSFLVPGFFETLTHRKPIFITLAIFQRLGIVFVAAATFLLALGILQPVLYLVIVFLSLTWYGVVSGCVAPLWYDFLGRQIPVNRRGLLLGLRDASGTILSIGILATFPFLTRSFSFPWSYSIIYAISMVLFMGSFIGFSFMKEVPYEAHEIKPRKPLVEQLAETLSILTEDKQFVKLLIALSVLSLPGLTNLSLISLKAMNILELSAEKASSFSSIVTIVNTVCASSALLFFGFLGDRLSNKKVGYIGYALFICAMIMAMFATSFPLFIAAVVLSAIGGGGITIFAINFPLEFAPENRRPSYMAMRSLGAAPFVILPFLGGWIADTFGPNPVFCAAGFFTILGLITLKLLVRDPRKRIAEVVQ